MRLLLLSATVLVSAGAAHAQHGPLPSQPAPDRAAASRPAESTEVDDDDPIVVLAPGDQSRIDRRTYTLRDDPAAQTGNMFDILGRVPAVSVAPSGAITLLGAGNVIIQINGQPTPDNNVEQVLRGLIGREVERIEVITNPPAHYSAQASGGIINIITRQRVNAGLGGTVQSSVDSMGGYYGGFAPSWSDGRFSLSGQINGFHNEQDQDFTRARSELPSGSDTVEIGEQSNETDGWSIGRARLGYSPSDRRRFGIAYDQIDVESRTSRRTATTDGGALLSTQSTDNTTTFYNRQIVFDGQISGGQPGELLRFSSMTQAHGAEFDQVFGRTPVGDTLSAFRARNEFDMLITNSQLDYERRLGENLLTLGASLNTVNQDIEIGSETLAGSATPPDFLSRLDGNQQTIGGYGTLQLKLGDWTVQPGVRLENYRREIVSGGGEAETIELETFPSVHIRRELTDDLDLSLSYTSRIQRPNPLQLDPALRFTDVNRALSGNMDLLPTMTNAYEANLTYQRGATNIGVTLYNRIAEDIVSPFTQTLPGGLIVTSPMNAGTSEQRGMQAILRGALSDRWRYSVTANALNREFDVLGPSGALTRRSEFEYDGSGQLDYRDADQNAVGADQLQFEVRFQGPRFTLQSDLDEFIVGNVTWRRRLSGNVFGVLSVQDAFSSQDQVQETTTATFSERSETSSPGARVRFALTYQFGAATDRPPPEQPPAISAPVQQ